MERKALLSFKVSQTADPTTQRYFLGAANHKFILLYGVATAWQLAVLPTIRRHVLSPALRYKCVLRSLLNEAKEHNTESTTNK